MIARRLLPVLGAGLLLVTACTDDDDAATATSSTATSPTAAVADSSAATSAEPMTTPRDVTQEVRDLLGTPGPTVERAEELAQAVADALVAAVPQCEAGPATATVASVTPGEPTFAVIELREGCDDSVAGARYDLAMEGDDTSGWGIVTATRQDICLRGDGGGELCV